MPVDLVQVNAILGEASKVISVMPHGADIKSLLGEATKLSRDLGNTLGMKSANPGEMLGTLRVVANDTKEAFAGIQGAVHNKNIAEIIKQTDKIATKLSNNEVAGKEMKSIFIALGQLIGSISKVVADGFSGNFIGMPMDIITALGDMKEAFQALKYGFQKFVKFYHEKIEPALHNVKIKLIDPVNKKISDAFHKKDAAADSSKDGSSHHEIKDFFQKAGDKFDKVFHISHKKKDASTDKTADATDMSKFLPIAVTQAMKVEMHSLPEVVDFGNVLHSDMFEAVSVDAMSY